MKFKNDLGHLRLFYVIILLILGSSVVFAQAEKPKVSADEAKAAKKIQDAKGFPDIMKTSSEFLTKYPQSTLRKQITGYVSSQVFASKDDNQSVANSKTYLAFFTDPAEADLVTPTLIETLIRLKKTDEAFAAADKYLPRHEDNTTVRLQLAVEGSNQLRSNNNKYVNQTKDYSSQAIQLIEANTKEPNLPDETWKEYQTKWLPELYTSLGLAYLNLSDKDTAQVCFTKATTLDPNNVVAWYMLASVNDEGYRELANKYMAANGTEKAQFLTKANEQLDKVIDLFARIVALTDGNATYQALNGQIKQDLEAYYKYRHNNSTNGLQDLINKYKPVKN